MTAVQLAWFKIARDALSWSREARVELADHLEFQTADETLAGIADVLRGGRTAFVRQPDKGRPS